MILKNTKIKKSPCVAVRVRSSWSTPPAPLSGRSTEFFRCHGVVGELGESETFRRGAQGGFRAV